MVLRPRIKASQLQGVPTRQVCFVPFHGSGSQGPETLVTCSLRSRTASNNGISHNDGVLAQAAGNSPEKKEAPVPFPALRLEDSRRGK